MLGHGGIPRDYARAAGGLRQAADAGHAEAMYTLANLHATGNGVPLDYEQARKLMLAAEPGLPEATRLSARASAVMLGQLLAARRQQGVADNRSEEHTSELQSIMRN